MRFPTNPTIVRLASLLRRGALSLSLPFLLAGSLEAGTINLNLTDTTATGTGADGTAILGGGTWNRLHKNQRALANALVKNSGAASPVTVTQSAGPEPDVISHNNGNPVQGESWYNGFGFTLAFSGLLPSQVHTVAVYSDRVGVDPNHSITVTGSGAAQVKSAPYPGVAVTALPGTEGPDYLLFTVTTTAGGGLSIATNFNMAGVQIRGVLPGELGPQADALVTKSVKAKSGKGNNVYGINPSPKQTLGQKAAGKRPRNYYAIMQNDGAEIDNLFLMAFLDRATKTKVFDQTTRKNITATAKARNYRFDLEAKASRKFKVTVASKRPKLARNSAVAICSSPSTLKTKKQDCVTCLLRR